jgi:hypothetical protein
LCRKITANSSDQRRLSKYDNQHPKKAKHPIFSEADPKPLACAMGGRVLGIFALSLTAPKTKGDGHLTVSFIKSVARRPHRPRGYFNGA